jgi:hypothetical protein
MKTHRSPVRPHHLDVAIWDQVRPPSAVRNRPGHPDAYPPAPLVSQPCVESANRTFPRHSLLEGPTGFASFHVLPPSVVRISPLRA